MYTGLFNFSLLIIFGLAGLVVTFGAPDIMHSGTPPTMRSVSFTAPSSLSDPQLGRLIALRVGAPPHAGSPYIHRDSSNNLVVDYYSVDGLVRATLLENANRIQIQNYRNSFWRFLDNVHASTIADRSQDPAVRAWTWYIEIAIWSLIAMCITGIWLAVSTQWRSLYTRIAVGFGCAVVAFFYFVER